MLQGRGLADRVEVDSAGTYGYHAGEPPDPRSQSAARRRGYSLAAQRSRQVDDADFYEFDYILAMDGSNLRDLEAMRPPNATARVEPFLDGSDGDREVPDPYSGGRGGFDRTLDIIERGVERLFERLELPSSA